MMPLRDNGKKSDDMCIPSDKYRNVTDGQSDRNGKTISRYTCRRAIKVKGASFEIHVSHSIKSCHSLLDDHGTGRSSKANARFCLHN